VGLYFTLEAKNNACEISASKRKMLLIWFWSSCLLVELSSGRVIFWSSWF
jgi:hypothetical protein